MTNNTAAKTSMLEVAVNAAGDGHDLGPFEPVDDENGAVRGYQAECGLCGQTAWVGREGVIYSLLGDICDGAVPF